MFYYYVPESGNAERISHVKVTNLLSRWDGYNWGLGIPEFSSEWIRWESSESREAVYAFGRELDEIELADL